MALFLKRRHARNRSVPPNRHRAFHVKDGIKTRSGFTLIELLTAIGIIAIVAAIALPVFAAVRERGRRAACQNNLRQIAAAIEMYVHDNDGQYPLPFIWQASAYPCVRNKQVFACPDKPQAYDGPIPLYDTGVIDYEYDIRRLDVFSPPFPTKAVRGISETALALPATIWLNMDREWSDADGSHYSREVTASCGQHISANTLHSGGGNYSFADGHVRWLSPEDFGTVECAAGPLPPPFKD